MAGDLRGFALEKAELLSSRLKEIVSAGQGYVRAQFGVDLGLKPELYPTWVILSTAAVALLLLLRLSWAAVSGGLLVGKKRGSPVTPSGGDPVRATFSKAAKPEEQKKRNKKKTPDKKTHYNGQPVTIAQEEVEVTEVVSKLSPQIKIEKQVQTPAQVKKNKKKTKTDVKPVQHVSSTDGKEPDDVGAWETKVSNQRKRQQRRKDKGPDDSGSPGGVEAPKTPVAAPVATASTNTKKNRGTHESLLSRRTGKKDAASRSVTSSWREETSVSGGWTDISLKLPGQISAMVGTKWSTISTAPLYRAPAEPQRWGQETQAAWSGIDGRTKTDLNPVSYSMLGLNTTDSISNSIELQWASRPDVDEWCGFKGMAAVDPSSDWNAPTEHWGNYEDPPVIVTQAPPLKDLPAPNKVSEDDKDSEDPSGGAAKSKKRKKKKKKTEEEFASESQMVSSALLVNAVPKPQELPIQASKKQNPNISPSQKKPEQIMEPPKPNQKKKVRRET